MKEVWIYSDGACSGNPGPGGWGAILVYGEHRRQISGGESTTTNNRMELTAVLEAVRLLKEPCRVHLVSDSKYVLDALQKGWVYGWQKRGWIKSDKKPALNADLWEALLEVIRPHTMEYEWIKGHAGHPENEACDAMAVEQSQKFRQAT